MTFQKGQSGNPAGKAKGTRAKYTIDLRNMILGALSDAGGRKYLAAQAKENPGAFLGLVGRILPKESHTPPGEQQHRNRYQLSLDELRAIAATALPTSSPHHRPRLIEADRISTRTSFEREPAEKKNGRGRQSGRAPVANANGQQTQQLDNADSSTSIQPDSTAAGEDEQP